VVELRRVEVSVIGVFASPSACDAVTASRRAGTVLRVAADEVALIRFHGRAGAPPAVADPDALVLDVSDGWSALALEGTDAREAFARLSELELPAAGALQGEVARVGARVVASRDRVVLLVPSMVEEHVHRRIVEDCADLLR
jgi:hypothetical protein